MHDVAMHKSRDGDALKIGLQNESKVNGPSQLRCSSLVVENYSRSICYIKGPFASSH